MVYQEAVLIKLADISSIEIEPNLILEISCKILFREGIIQANQIIRNFWHFQYRFVSNKNG